jgi:hypothetical protein
MNIDEARAYLVENNKYEYKDYIMNKLAGDFAVEMAKEHKALKQRSEKYKKKYSYLKDAFIEAREL